MTFNPTYKYHLGCNIYSGEPLPPGLAGVKAVESSSNLSDMDSDLGDTDAARTGMLKANIERCDSHLVWKGVGSTILSSCANKRQHCVVCC